VPGVKIQILKYEIMKRGGATRNCGSVQLVRTNVSLELIVVSDMTKTAGNITILRKELIDKQRNTMSGR
jgi:hypothetical protein